MYSIEFSRTAEKQLYKLEKEVQKRIVDVLERIRIRPFHFVKKKEIFWNEQEAIFWKSFKGHDLPEKFDQCGRNDQCPCKSGKKFKRCHIDYDNWWNNLTEAFDGYPFVHVKSSGNNYIIEGAPIIEGPIDQY